MELNERDITLIHFLIIDRMALLEIEKEKAQKSLEYKSAKEKEKEIEELKGLLKKVRF